VHEGSEVPGEGPAFETSVGITARRCWPETAMEFGAGFVYFCGT
jgi:hypothetical protein